MNGTYTYEITEENGSCRDSDEFEGFPRNKKGKSTKRGSLK